MDVNIKNIINLYVKSFALQYCNILYKYTLYAASLSSLKTLRFVICT